MKKYHYNTICGEIGTEKIRDKMLCSLGGKERVENFQMCRSEKYHEEEC